MSRLSALKSVLSYWRAEPMTVEQIGYSVSEYPEWRRENSRTGKWQRGDRLPANVLERELIGMLAAHKDEFIETNSGLWRRRDPNACSFCLTEDVQVCARGKFASAHICLECAKLVVEVLQEGKDKRDEIAAREAAIMRCEEMLGA